MPSLSRLFRRPDYQSDVTRFLNQLKAEQPDLEAAQRAGRALLWDKPVDRQALAELRAGQLPQPAYVYQTEPTQKP